MPVILRSTKTKEKLRNPISFSNSDEHKKKKKKKKNKNRIMMPITEAAQFEQSPQQQQQQFSSLCSKKTRKITSFIVVSDTGKPIFTRCYRTSSTTTTTKSTSSNMNSIGNKNRSNAKESEIIVDGDKRVDGGKQHTNDDDDRDDNDYENEWLEQQLVQVCAMIQVIRTSLLHNTNVLGTMGDIRTIRGWMNRYNAVFMTVVSITLVAIEEIVEDNHNDDDEQQQQQYIPITRTATTEVYLRLILEYIYSQIIFNMTNYIDVMYQYNYSFDLQSVLTNTSLIRSVTDQMMMMMMTTTPSQSSFAATDINSNNCRCFSSSYLLQSVQPVFPLSEQVRERTCRIIQQVVTRTIHENKHEQQQQKSVTPPLFAILFLISSTIPDSTTTTTSRTSNRLVSIVQPSHYVHQMKVSDLHIVLEFISKQYNCNSSSNHTKEHIESIDGKTTTAPTHTTTTTTSHTNPTAELWIPICLPRFNSSSFMHCYTQCLASFPSSMSMPAAGSNNTCHNNSDTNNQLILAFISPVATIEQLNVLRLAATNIRYELNIPEETSSTVMIEKKNGTTVTAMLSSVQIPDSNNENATSNALSQQRDYPKQHHNSDVNRDTCSVNQNPDPTNLQNEDDDDDCNDEDYVHIAAQITDDVDESYDKYHPPGSMPISSSSPTTNQRGGCQLLEELKFAYCNLNSSSDSNNNNDNNNNTTKFIQRYLHDVVGVEHFMFRLDVPILNKKPQHQQSSTRNHHHQHHPIKPNNNMEFIFGQHSSMYHNSSTSNNHNNHLQTRTSDATNNNNNKNTVTCGYLSQWIGSSFPNQSQPSSDCTTTSSNNSVNDCTIQWIWCMYQKLNLRLRLSGSTSDESVHDAFDSIIQSNKLSSTTTLSSSSSVPTAAKSSSSSSSSIIEPLPKPTTIDQHCPAMILLETPPSDPEGISYVVQDDKIFLGMNGNGFEIYLTASSSIPVKEVVTKGAKLVRRILADEKILFLSNPLTWTHDS